MTLYATTQDRDAGQQLAGVTGIERRDAALILAARSLCGVDVSMPQAGVATVAGPGGAPSWTLATLP